LSRNQQLTEESEWLCEDSRKGELDARIVEMRKGCSNFWLGRNAAERHGATDWDARGHGRARAGRRQLHEEEHRERKRHENTNDEKGRVAVPPSDAQAAGLCLGIARCDGAHIRLLAQIRNRKSVPMRVHSAMIRVACKIPLWKMSV